MIVITGNSDAEGSAGSGGTEQAGTYVGEPERLQHGQEPASAWVQRWSHLVPAKGRVLDVACGQGRHAYWFYQRGHAVTVVDRSQQAVASIAIPAPWCEAVVADIEQGSWPFAGRQFDAVVVTNYLWRPLQPTLLASIAPGGVLLYETFAQGHQSVGRPSRPDFLLRHGELLEVCRDLRIVAFEEGFQQNVTGIGSRFIQRIAAVKETSAASMDSNPDALPRYALP